MLRKRTAVLLAAALTAMLVSAPGTLLRADGADQILDGDNLKYVNHVNNLPEGETTLWVRAFGPVGSTTLAKIQFSAEAAGGGQLSKTLFANFRAGEEKKFVIDWGKRITYLNFIWITAIRTTTPPNPPGGGNCQVDSKGKVTICHYPPGNPGNPQTIRINASALPAHLAHGDSCGPCSK